MSFREELGPERRLRLLDDRLRRVEQTVRLAVGDWVIEPSGPSGPGQQLVARNTVTNTAIVIGVA